MLLLLDIGNTHTHAALANGDRVTRPANLPTGAWQDGQMIGLLEKHFRSARITEVAFCSVVPRASAKAGPAIRRHWKIAPFQLTHQSVGGITIDYPTPQTIGADRLANALAARKLFGAPVVVVDFGTAVTFDVVNKRGAYVGGIIAPGLAAMTSYLHEKTALLPEIKIREVNQIVGKSTEQAMLIGAVHGYRGLVRELILKLKSELGSRRLPVVATGGYAKLMANKLPEITSVDSLLTLKGLKLACELGSSNATQATDETRMKHGHAK